MSASIYSRLGVKPIINCSGAVTRLGGSVMHPLVIQAMAEAAQSFVEMPELLKAAGERIAELTATPAAYITSGAAAGLLLATAACVAGKDPAKIARLPDTQGMKNEVVIHRQQRMNFDHAIRTVGVKLVDIGWSHSVTHPWELESAIHEQTAAVVFVVSFASAATLPLSEVIRIAHAAQVPVIVDAAPDLPPKENLHKFTGMGADLVVFSGGKAIQGPQSTGFIVGRPDLIEACALNSAPNHNTIGRPLKVGKEEIAGLVCALELFLQGDEQKEKAILHARNDHILQRLAPVASIKAWQEPQDEAGRPLPHLYIEMTEIAEAKHAAALVAVAAQLRQGDPPIHLMVKGNRLAINPQMMAAGEEEIVAARLAALLAG